MASEGLKCLLFCWFLRTADFSFATNTVGYYADTATAQDSKQHFVSPLRVLLPRACLCGVRVVHKVRMPYARRSRILALTHNTVRGAVSVFASDSAVVPILYTPAPQLLYASSGCEVAAPENK